MYFFKVDILLELLGIRAIDLVGYDGCVVQSQVRRQVAVYIDIVLAELVGDRCQLRIIGDLPDPVLEALDLLQGHVSDLVPEMFPEGAVKLLPRCHHSSRSAFFLAHSRNSLLRTIESTRVLVSLMNSI